MGRTPKKPQASPVFCPRRRRWRCRRRNRRARNRPGCRPSWPGAAWPRLGSRRRPKRQSMLYIAERFKTDAAPEPLPISSMPRARGCCWLMASSPISISPSMIPFTLPQECIQTCQPAACAASKILLYRGLKKSSHRAGLMKVASSVPQSSLKLKPWMRPGKRRLMFAMMPRSKEIIRSAKVPSVTLLREIKKSIPNQRQ